MPAKTEQLPKTPTRERRVYLACARVYANLFRAVFVAPLEARRSFRRLAEGRSADAALDALWQQPDALGEHRTAPDHVHDPAFVYWTFHARRPRTLLKRAAAAIARELRRRDHQHRVDAARRAETRAREASGEAYSTRDQGIRAVRDFAPALRWVYVDPKAAARKILRATRTRGADKVARVIEHEPDFFGALKVNRVPYFRDVPILRDWGWLARMVLRDTHEEALSHVPRLVQRYRTAAAARAARAKAGRARSAKDDLAQKQARVREVEAFNAALLGGLKEAAPLLAQLLRRRAVDEQPEGDKGPPPISKQLAAMLPDRAAQLIHEALNMAEKESGDEHAGWQLELARKQRGQEQQRPQEQQRGRDRGGWERERSSGGYER
jgi:hypothetical protein